MGGSTRGRLSQTKAQKTDPNRPQNNLQFELRNGGFQGLQFTGQFLFKEMGPYCLFLTAFWSKIVSFQLKGFEGPIMCDIMGQFLFKEMGPYCLFLTAFWSKIVSFQLKGFEGPIMCDIMGQFLFKEMGPYCLFLTVFWSKIGFPNVKAQRKDPSRQPSDPKNVGTLN